MSEGSEDDHALIRRKHIGIVFQFFNLLEGMSVLENVAPCPRSSRDATASPPSRAPATCWTCWASPTRRRRCPACSRVASASDSPSRGRSPTSRRCLLADEPTGALDSVGGQEVIELLSRLHAAGQTIILVTHDANVANAADTVLRMRDGRIVSDGDADTDGDAVTTIGTL
jgi:putative ABC transport system ATP-binding protein